jgi:hypothetical protein
LLYFGSSGGGVRLESRRALTWFFAHFFYLSALIIMLQGIATSLSYSNVSHGIAQQITATKPILDFMDKNPGVNVSSAEFPETESTFETMGLSLESFVRELDIGIHTASLHPNESYVAMTTTLQQVMLLINNVLKKSKVTIDPSSLLAAKQLVFSSSKPSNATNINISNFVDIYNEITVSYGSSALWFYGAAGSTLLALVLLSLIRGWPRDKWEWGSIISRLITGVTVVSLSALDIGSSKPLLNTNLTTNQSKIWYIVKNDRLLPIFAILIGLLQLTEYVLVHMANRAYYEFWKIPIPFLIEAGLPTGGRPTSLTSFDTFDTFKFKSEKSESDVQDSMVQLTYDAYKWKNG